MNALRRFVDKYRGKRPDHKGANNPNWKGGVRKLGPYYYVQRDHPRAVKYRDTPYVMRAVVRLEEKLGRRLRPNELPHHKDGIKVNDAARNLEVQTKDAHRRTHHAGLSNAERTRMARDAVVRTKQFEAAHPVREPERP